MIPKTILAALLMALPTGQLPAQASPPLFDADSGMRIAQYRAPVGPPPRGVAQITADEAIALHRGPGALFIDVLPAAGGHRDPKTGTWALAEPHHTIPGAHWFPESGRGVLAPDIESWFLTGVARLSDGSRTRPIIVFCLADCWMSWNAARRLAIAGYKDVRWFAEGTDGWTEVGGATETGTPER